MRRPYPSARRALAAVVVPFAVSRAGVLLIGLAAAVFIGFDPAPNESAKWRVAADPFRNLLARWDTFWYLDIAAHGYRWTGNPLVQQNVVFFPLYPTLMRVGGAMLGGRPLVAGLLVSLAAFLTALVYLWRLVAVRFDENTATWTIALLCAYPFAVYFSAVYTEALFLLATVGAFFHLHRDEFGRAAWWGVVAGFTRPNGFLLAAPAAWFAVAAVPLSARGRAMRVLAVAAPLAGAVGYSAYLHAAAGDGFAWIADQAAWLTFAPTRTSVQPAGTPGTPIWDVVIYVGDAAAIGLAAASLWPTAKRCGPAYSLFVALNLATPVLRHGLLSMGRFTSVMFPIFIWLAEQPRAGRRRLVLAGWAVAQAVAAALFFTWRPLV